VNDDSPRFGGLLDVQSRNITLEYGVTFAQQITISVRPGYQHFRGAGQKDGFVSVGVGPARRVNRSPWGAGLTSTYTRVGDGRQLRGDATFSYRLSTDMQFATQIRYTRVSRTPMPFNEAVGSERLTHRW
jgi:hypothetical protein